MTIPYFPPLVTLVLAHHAPLIITLVSQWLYDQLLRREQDHELVLIDQHFNFTPLELACADFRSDSARGTPATHPVPRLLRLLLLQQFYSLSLRECAERLRYNWLWRWFCGYSLWQETPSHSTLHRFQLWVRQHQPDLCFATICDQIRADCPEEAHQPLIGDSFAMRADAAVESRLRRLRHTAQQIVRLLGLLPPALAERARAALQLESEALFGDAEEPSEFRLADWRATTCTTAAACARWLAALRPLLAPTLLPSALQQRLDQLDKILADEFHLHPDEHGRVESATLRKKGERGSYAIGSATDPEASFRVHGEEAAVLGYNVSIIASQRYIWQVRAATGAEPDAVAIVDMLEGLYLDRGSFPDKLIYDRAAGTGKLMADVQRATDGQTQLVARLIDFSARSERFGPADFTLSEDGQVLTCPNEVQSERRYRAGTHTQAWQFRFSANDCHACPLWARCRDPRAKPDGFRTVTLSDHRDVVQEAHAYQRSADFKADMRLRPLVERPIACLVRYHGARRARARGIAAADFQVKGAAIAYNLRAWLKLLRHRDKSPPGTA